MTTPSSHPRNPLHGVTLEQIINRLVQRYGWNEMADRIPIRCFQFDPSVKSSLTFLRKTPWQGVWLAVKERRLAAGTTKG